MFQHSFLFNSGCWIGEGQIELSAFEEKLAFFTRWRSNHPDPDFIEFESNQEIQVSGHSDIMMNQFFFTGFDSRKFDVELDNQAWGKVYGEGIVDEKFIGWEFRTNDVGFEGYEYYELQDDGTYKMRAEFATEDDFRTSIEGKIWKQLSKSTTE